MRRDQSLYLRHILDSIAQIESYLQGIDEAAFQQNNMVQDAVIRQLEIIGEAVKLLSPELRDEHRQVHWSDIARMRDKLIHGYFGVDIDKVWLTTQDDLPVLKVEVAEMLDELLRR
ncbi:MAG: DUF86 domain-containing protein [Pyrinomonadaceae bacterium]